MADCEMVGMLSGGKWDKLMDVNRRVYSINGISPTVTTCGGGNQEVKIAEPMIIDPQGRTKKECAPTDYCPTLRAQIHGNPPQVVSVVGNTNPSGRGMNGNVFNSNGLAPTLTTNKGEGNKILEPNIRIRKLTPKECFRLMDFADEDFDKAKAALNRTFYNGRDRSNSQLYKQAGNSIVVACLKAIFNQMMESEEI
jgi:DNA (cytosine-5)-methyltransferase 1